ncbi:unnamed protein product [marine sediment metagenome]|uniref:Transcription regulator AsnC/Lrp ligand binding domain-containing protein n=1 Tax=marine sediment metagenome TaxID=412755 RepID=X0YVV4_9ZZZZ
MSMAYILINMDLGHGAYFTEELGKIPEITELYNVYGVYDFIVKVEAETMDQLKDIVKSKIRNLDYIKSTLTMLVVE